jgi:soluble lytic murein transglycosylase-like protein
MVSEIPYRSPVVWRSAYLQLKRKWWIRFIFVNLFYGIIVLILGLSLTQSEKRAESFSFQKSSLEDYKAREAIYSILKSKGISLNQGMDIAEATLHQSKVLDIPMSLILAVMKKESMFDPRAVSSKQAMGLMQVHPVTWNEYVGKLNLNVSNYAAFDPVANITVATHVLKDLYEDYRETARSESELWDSVLSAYYAGKHSFSQTGMGESHKKYVADVNRFKYEFDQRLGN